MKLLFLGLFLIGISITVFLPPFQGPDEAAHWKTAINQASVIFPECSFEKSLPNFFESNRIVWHSQEKLALAKFSELNSLRETCKTRDVAYSNVFSYPTVLVSAALTWWMPSNPWTAVFRFYLSRLLGGVAFLLIVSQVLRRGFSLPLFLFVASPLLLQQVFTVSGDTVVLLFVGYSILLLQSSKVCKFLGYEIYILGLLGVGVAANKPTILPVLFFMALFSRKKGQNSLGILYLLLMASVFLFLRNDSISLATTESINPHRQIDFVLENIWGTFRALWRTVRAALWPATWVSPLGYLETTLLFGFPIVWSLVWFLSWPIQFRFSNFLGRRLELFSAFLGVVLMGFLSALAMYLVYTPVGYHMVLGMQSRYIFPALLFGIFLIGHDRSRGQKSLKGWGFVISQGMLVYSIFCVGYSLVSRYWVV